MNVVDVSALLMPRDGSDLIGDANTLAAYRAGRERLQQEIVRAVEDSDWDRLFPLLGHHERGNAFTLFGHRFQPIELNALLAEWWNMTEGVRPEHTLELFHRAGFVTDGPELPGGELTVYRGCRIPRHRLGMSWTLDVAQARFFAQRYGGPGTGVVYRALVESSDVLGYFTSREEEEIIVDSSTLHAITRLTGEDVARGI